MGKQCLNCGKELKDNAKFCGKCGSKYEEKVQDKDGREGCKKCGHKLNQKMKFCPKCGTEIKAIESGEKSKIEQVIEMASSGIIQAESVFVGGVDKSREKFNEIQNMSNEERKERAKQYANTAKEKGVEFAGDIKDFKNLSKKKIIAILCGIIIGVIFISKLFGGNSEVTYSDFLQRYNELSQERFVEAGISEWEEITPDVMERIQGEASRVGQFKDSENITIYVYQYQGWISSPGTIFVYEDENGKVIGANFAMSIEYIAGEDNFHNIVLDSLIQAFVPGLSENEIYEIKSNFSMQDHLVGAVTRGINEAYQQDEITYMVHNEDGWLYFSMYLSDELNW